MDLHIASDLHLGHCAMNALPVCADALVLAGDISDGGDLRAVVQVAAHYLQDRLPVLFVPGNHEFYGRELESTRQHFAQQAAELGITLLDNQSTKLLGVDFFGSTFWTDYRYGSRGDDALQRENMQLALGGIADHSRIRYAQGTAVRRFSPQDALRLHDQSVQALRSMRRTPLAPLVVITHHAPLVRCTAPKWQGSPLNAAFASDCAQLMHDLGPVLWIHGHMHDSVDLQEGVTRVVCNPRGYALRNDDGAVRTENPLFSNSFYVRVPDSPIGG